jgi:hypothetical protein
VEIGDLTPDEQLALVALIEFVAESNANVTDEEVEEISHLVEAVGERRYRDLVDEVDDRFDDEDDLRDFLSGITRQEARDLIFGVTLETALSDADNLKHSEILDWLREEWEVSVEIDRS